jgi:hypothetical protein
VNKGGVKKQQVWERTGSHKARYSSIHKYHNIEVKVDEKELIFYLSPKRNFNLRNKVLFF